MAKCCQVFHFVVIALLFATPSSPQVPATSGCNALAGYDQTNPAGVTGVIYHSPDDALKYGTDADDDNGIYRIWNYVKNLGPARVAFSWPKGHVGISNREGGLGKDKIACNISHGANPFLAYDAPITIGLDRVQHDARVYQFQFSTRPSYTVSTLGIEHLRNGDAFDVYVDVVLERQAAGDISMAVTYSPPSFGVGISNAALGLSSEEIVRAAGTLGDRPVQGPLDELLPNWSEADRASVSSMFGSDALRHDFFVLSGVGRHELPFTLERNEQDLLSIPLILLNPEHEPLAFGSAVFGDIAGLR